MQALRERGNVYMKQGNLKAAAKDFEEIVSFTFVGSYIQMASRQSPWPSGWGRLSLALKITRHLTALGSSLARIICETSQVLLVDGHVVFLGDLPHFRPTLRLTQNEWNDLDQNKKKNGQYTVNLLI